MKSLVIVDQTRLQTISIMVSLQKRWGFRGSNMWHVKTKNPLTLRFCHSKYKAQSCCYRSQNNVTKSGGGWDHNTYGLVWSTSTKYKALHTCTCSLYHHVTYRGRCSISTLNQNQPPHQQSSPDSIQYSFFTSYKCKLMYTCIIIGFKF